MVEWVDFISTVGFPIVIALYVLMRLENTLKQNTQAIEDLKDLIELKASFK